MEQEIRYLTRPDGARIAYSILGDGPALVFVWPWGHLEREWEMPGRRSALERFARSHTVVRFDRHGTGVSDRDRTDFSLEADLLDLDALVSHLGLESFAMTSMFFAAPIVVTYAARHPELVTDLVFQHAFARGELIAPPAVQRVMLESIEVHWGLGSRTIASMQMPGLDHDALEWLARWNRESVDAPTARGIAADAYRRDVRKEAKLVRARTLVLHHRTRPMSPPEAARELASLIPGATFKVIEGTGTEAASRATDAIAEFLGDAAVPVATAPVTVLATDRATSTKLTHELGDEAAQELQRIHDREVREALRTSGGTEVKHLGDGIMATFTSPSAAIACAIAIQRALAPHPDVQVRIGLAAGEVVSEGGDIFGSTVQLAFRARDRARPGQILVPEAVRQLAGVKRFRFAEPRTVALKGFPERVRLYDVASEEEPER